MVGKDCTVIFLIRPSCSLGSHLFAVPVEDTVYSQFILKTHDDLDIELNGFRNHYFRSQQLKYIWIQVSFCA